MSIISSPPRRVLVLRFSSAGDVVLTSPAIHALKSAWPETEIIYAIRSAFAPLVEHDPHVSHVVALEKGESLWRYAARLRALEPGAILDIHGKLRSKLLRLLLPGLPRVVWTKRRFGSGVPVRLGLTPYDPKMMLSDRFHAAVEKLVGRTLPRGELRYWVGPEEQAEADRLLADAGLDIGRPLLGMSPGASWETKRWPEDRFAELARRALGRGYQVAVTGSWGEKPLNDSIVRLAPGTKDLSGVVSLRALGGLINRCSAWVANDSGPMHIARALGVPTLAFFGSTSPHQFEFDGHGMMFAGVDCAPCHMYGRRTCPRGHFRCMLDLDADAAWRTLEPLLGGGRRLPVHA